jgi:hypothetical protein
MRRFQSPFEGNFALCDELVSVAWLLHARGTPTLAGSRAWVGVNTTHGRRYGETILWRLLGDGDDNYEESKRDDREGATEGSSTAVSGTRLRPPLVRPALLLDRYLEKGTHSLDAFWASFASLIAAT